ncbi:YhcN/YlaJ family sporulation lipoprotein [Paenibacillus flagellatus]|uniref:YhcN/YlaJ family sporulation lipoprotein n=1 Tax=Paenibacillus flagellatus TaxID=2211139 RepID=UPI00130521EA|nr:YhcN/YlaJ family sporulation lipoprotein [Paenibacillus flagellatus]
MAAKTIRLAVLASLVAVTAAGCTNARHESSGTNDGAKTSNYRPYQYGTGNTDDMRLGLDRYRGNDPDLIRDADDLRRGLNRDNGATGYDRDGVNRWSDYHDRTGATGTETYGVHNNSTVQSAQDIASQLTAVDPVQTANVLVTNNNAYVAVSTKDGQDIEKGDVKTRIADRVQALRPDIKNVYVSANPDFVGRVNGYVQQLNAGKPVSGFIHEFNTMVQRLFPANASGSRMNTSNAADGLTTKTSDGAAAGGQGGTAGSATP